MLYDRAMRGVLHALDDRAFKEGILIENAEGERVLAT